MEFDIMRKLCAEIRLVNVNLPYVIFVNTNGTLAHGQIQEWLKRNKYVRLGLSLDGSPTTHNFNRSNSYNLIDFAFFLENYPTQPVKMTINNNTLANLAADIIHIHDLGFKISASFALGIDWEDVKYSKILIRELKILSDYYLDNPHIIPCTLFSTNFLLLYLTNKPKWCGTHTYMVSIDVDGNEYPCQSFQPNTTGNKEANLPLFPELDDWSDPECGDCLINNICSSCYGFNFMQFGDILTQDKTMCALKKVVALACSYYTGCLIERGKLDLTPQDMAKTIKAVNDIQDAYSKTMEDL